MAAVKKVTKVSHITAKQRAADAANLKKARAALAGKTRTAKQVAASRRNLAKARATVSARRAAAASKAKTPATKKKPKAAGPDTWTVGADLDLHALPVCGSVAIAAHLTAFTGAAVPDYCVLELAELVQDATMDDLLEYVRADGFPGTGEKLAHFERCDPGTEVPGLVYGLQLPTLGYHAVLAHPDGPGALSWGVLVPWCRLLPWRGAPEEAWWLEWEGE